VTGEEFPFQDALGLLRGKLPEGPEVFLVLGSGLGVLAEGLGDGVSIPFNAIPGFPDAGVSGHAGQMVAGRLGGRPVLIQSGRFHLYEGYDPAVVAAPIRLAAQLGAGTVLLTNAAGGISRDLGPGSILLLKDHINFMGRSPLAGPVQGGEERFPDLSEPYDGELRELAREVAADLGIPLSEGVYAAVLGPSYETPAEIGLLARAGADAVGMSTVPEAITARALGLRVLAFSLVTNRAAGLSSEPLRHDEVLEVGRESGKRLASIITSLLDRMGD
jgi:purine-nucleoside phosphorylase